MIYRGIRNRKGNINHAQSEIGNNNCRGVVCYTPVYGCLTLILLFTILLITSTSYAATGAETSQGTIAPAASSMASLTDTSVNSMSLPKSEKSSLANKSAAPQYAAASSEEADAGPVTDQVQPEDVQADPVDMQDATGGEGTGFDIVSDLSISSINVSMVGNTGAAVTSIPIVVPPGRKGMEPRLALNYNSNNRNGWIGIGWTLDMGAIQRNTKRGVDYSPDESDDVPDYVATVNGSTSELVKRNTWDTVVDGISYTGYQAKIEGAFIKYLYNSAEGWLAITKDGTKYYYGKSSTSRQDNAHGVFKWCLDRVEDTNGNYMTINYSKDQGQIYLDRINYTGNINTEQATSNYVKFYLEERTDKPSMYTTNVEVKTVKRLKVIEVSVGVYPDGNLVREFELEYLPNSSSTGRSLLRKVTQFGNDGIQSLPPITLSYNEPAHGFPYSSYWYGNGGGQDNNFIGDYDGDSKSDMAGYALNGSWYVCLSIDIDFSCSFWSGHSGDENNNFLGDYDGDGKTDMAGYTGSNGDWHVCLSTGTGFNCSFWSGHSGGENNNFLGDYDGDGKTDMAGYTGSSGLWHVCLSTGTGFDCSNWAGHGGVGINNALGDFNGDGMTDMAGYTGSNGDWHVCLSTGTGFNCSNYLWSGHSGGGNNNFLGDYNGDGTTDMAGYTGSNGDWHVCLSTGTDFNCSLWTGHTGGQDNNFIGDYNGDGKSDMAGYTGSNGDWHVCLSTGTGFNCSLWTGHAGGQENNFLGDYNGDGKSDMAGYTGSNGVWHITMTSDMPTDHLASVNNGIGGTTTLEYEPSSSYDNQRLPFIVQTLSLVTVNDGNGNTSGTTYNYYGGYFDYDDRSFWGFNYVSATAPNGTMSESWFINDIYEKKGLLEEQLITDSAGNIYTQTLNYYGCVSPDAVDCASQHARIFFPFLNDKYDYVYDGTATALEVRTQFGYDDYGNIDWKKYHGNTAISEDDREEYIYYYEDESKWIVSLPLMVSIEDGSSNLVAETYYDYYTNTGNLWTVETWLDTDPVNNPRTFYDYYDNGDLKTVTDPEGNITTYGIYYTTDNWMIFTYNEVNIGQGNQRTISTLKKYNYEYGKVDEARDPNSKTTYYDYDKFGRIQKITNPNDLGSAYGTVYYSYPGFGTAGSQRVVTYATEQSDTGNTIWSEAYFDGLGRTIKTRAEGPDNKVIATKTIYNNRGLIYSKSLPYFEDIDDIEETTHVYDPVGRVTAITSPDGSFSTLGYDKGTLTRIDPENHKKVEIKDVYGRVIEIKEYLGNDTPQEPYSLYATTIYDYDVLGNLRFVTDAQNHVTEIRYDSLSRKTWMKDPDMGVWQYFYDANGNLERQIDAETQEIWFYYDELNRITYKDYGSPSEFDIIYEYDDSVSTNSIGRLSKITDASGTTEFKYDKVGNTSKTIKTVVGGASYPTETTFDALGRIKEMKYPDDTIFKYWYDTGGNLLKVTNAGDTYKYTQYAEYNALGQVGKIDYGNGITTDYLYNDGNEGSPVNYRLRKVSTYEKGNPGNKFMDLTYTHDYAGNILTITDGLDSTKNKFYFYDELYRLEEAFSDLYGGTLSYTYHKDGNIKKNCRYGDYYYTDTKHKHAATSIKVGANEVATFAYDDNGNMTSSFDANTGMSRNITYDYDNRPTSITYNSNAVVSVYDAGGQRIKKVFTQTGQPTKTTTYIGDIYECTDGSCTKYVFGGSQRIARINGSDTSYYHSDHLGSSSVITDSQAGIEQTLDYYPFGEIKAQTGSQTNTYAFTDQEWDAETGLYYYNARYYDPKLARFISADTVVPDFLNPQSLNRYSYVINNPVLYVDPSGHFFGIDDLIIGAIVGAIISGASGGDVAQGALFGAVGGALFSGVGGFVGENIAHAGIAGGIGAPTAGWAAAGQIGGAMAGGASAGAATAAMAGGDIGHGALYGAIGGGAFGAIGAAYGDSWTLDRVALHGFAGGGVSELAGGSFQDGFMFAAVPAASRFLYNEWVNYDATWKSGGNVAPKDRLSPPVKGANNVGGQGVPDYWAREGSPISQFGNRIPGVNAVAGMHDIFQINLEIHGGRFGGFYRSAFNVPGMIPAAAMSYTALMTDYSSVVNYQTVLMRD